MYGVKIYASGNVILEFWHSTIAGALGLLNEHEKMLSEDGFKIEKILLSYEGDV